MKILLTGANGQLGREFIDAAYRLNLQIVALTAHDLDITRAESVEAAICRDDIDVMINCAAYTHVDNAEDHAQNAERVNAIGLEHVAKSCAAAKIPLIHFSTDYIFDGRQASGYSETSIPCPVNQYGRTKLAGETNVQQCCERFLIFRVSWVFGQYGKNFVKTMLRLGNQRDQLDIVSDQVSAPMAAAFIAETVLNLLQHPAFNCAQYPWGVYHMTSQPAISWADFAEEIFAQATAMTLLDRPVRVVPITSDQFPTKAKRPLNTHLVSHKSILGEPLPVCDWRASLRLVLQQISQKQAGG